MRAGRGRSSAAVPIPTAIRMGRSRAFSRSRSDSTATSIFISISIIDPVADGSRRSLPPDAGRAAGAARVAVGHVTKLSALGAERFAAIAKRLADAGVAVTVLPATDLFLMGRGHDHDVPRGVDAGASAARARRRLLDRDQQRAQSVHAVRRLLVDPDGEPLRQCRADRPARPNWRRASTW